MKQGLRYQISGIGRALSNQHSAFSPCDRVLAVARPSAEC